MHDATATASSKRMDRRILHGERRNVICQVDATTGEICGEVKGPSGKFNGKPGARQGGDVVPRLDWAQQDESSVYKLGLGAARLILRDLCLYASAWIHVQLDNLVRHLCSTLLKPSDEFL